MNNLKRKIAIFYMLLFGVSYNSFSQKTITGLIQDSVNKKPIEFASIILRKAKQNSIIGYAYSDSKGHYSLKFSPSQKDYILSASHLGYTEKRFPLINLDSTNSTLEQNFSLDQNVKNLEEVVVIQRRRMVTKSDTITFRADSFSNGQEKVAEDLLKKIPGLEIDSKGFISVHGKQIDRILIGGDDISDRNYKLLFKKL